MGSVFVAEPPPSLFLYPLFEKRSHNLRFPDEPLPKSMADNVSMGDLTRKAQTITAVSTPKPQSVAPIRADDLSHDIAQLDSLPLSI
jgi:hypothetical protein